MAMIFRTIQAPYHILQCIQDVKHQKSSVTASLCVLLGGEKQDLLFGIEKAFLVQTAYSGSQLEYMH